MFNAPKQDYMRNLERLRQSSFLRKIPTALFPPNPSILGDSAFPFKTWLTKPFTNAVLTPQKHYFNYRLSRARMVTECAYGQLKGRWWVLERKCESPSEIVRMVTLACIVLHNICNKRGDTISRKLDMTLDQLTNNRSNRDEIRRLLLMRNCQWVNDNSHQASCIRNALSQMFWREKQGLQVSWLILKQKCSNCLTI